MNDSSSAYLCVVRRHQNHIPDLVPIHIWDTKNRQRAVQAGGLRLLPPDITWRQTNPPGSLALNVFTSIYSQTKKTNCCFLFSTPGFIPDPKTCTLLRLHRCRQWQSEVITYSAVPLTSVFVNSWELVRMGHQAVPGSACVFVQTTLSPVELRFQRTLPQGPSICPVHC